MVKLRDSFARILLPTAQLRCTHSVPPLVFPQRVLPVIDLGSKQEDSLGWQLREMNHLVLPHIKNAVLEAALAVTQVFINI